MMLYLIMNMFITQFKIDVKCLLQHSSQIWALVATEITMYLLLRFGVAPHENAKIVPAMLLGALVLTLLHGTYSSFDEDAHYDRISGWHSAGLALEWIIFSRFIAHLLMSACPLVVCFTALIWLEYGDTSLAINAGYIMLQVAILVVACGLVAASFGVCFKMSAGFAHLLILPFLFSVVIFASSAMLQALIGTELQNNSGVWLSYSCAIFAPFACLLCAKLL